MIRRTLYDILNMQNFDAAHELRKLKEMFEKEKVAYIRGVGSCSFYNCISDEWFRHFPDRRRYTSLYELQSDMKRICMFLHYDSLNELLLYCEFVKFVLAQCMMSREYASFSFIENARILEEQMERILEASNHQWLCQEDGSWIVIEKNPVALEVAEIVPDEKTSTKILEYNHFELKGDIEGKKAILKSLGDAIEPITKTKEWKSSAYTSLGSDVGYLLNNFNIRHNNTEGVHKKNYISEMPTEELEQWYDKTYECILAVIILNEQLKTGAEIKRVKALMEQ